MLDSLVEPKAGNDKFVILGMSFLSLRGAKRRSNPEKERACTGLLRYARNDDGKKIAASSAAMTGEIYAAMTCCR